MGIVAQHRENVLAGERGGPNIIGRDGVAQEFKFQADGLFSPIGTRNHWRLEPQDGAGRPSSRVTMVGSIENSTAKPLM